MPPHVPVWGYRAFNEVVKMRAFGWALIQPDWRPYKKGSGHTEIDIRDVCTQRKGHVRAQRGGHLQVKERDRRRNQTSDTLILNF